MDSKDNFFGPEITVNGETQAPAEAKAEETPAKAPAADKVEEKSEKILGKFNSQEELEKGYTELEREFTRTRQAARPVETKPEMTNDNPQLDPEVVPALDTWYQKRREAEKAAEFERKHADELQDRLLRATIRDVMSDHNTKGQYIDQEDALKEAKKVIADSVTPQVKDAEKESFKEGQEVARQKDQLGAIGTPGVRTQVDESKLSSKELEKYLNIPRAN